MDRQGSTGRRAGRNICMGVRTGVSPRAIDGQGQGHVDASLGDSETEPVQGQPEGEEQRVGSEDEEGDGLCVCAVWIVWGMSCHPVSQDAPWVDGHRLRPQIRGRPHLWARQHHPEQRRGRGRGAAAQCIGRRGQHSQVTPARAYNSPRGPQGVLGQGRPSPPSTPTTTSGARCCCCCCCACACACCWGVGRPPDGRDGRAGAGGEARRGGPAALEQQGVVVIRSAVVVVSIVVIVMVVVVAPPDDAREEGHWRPCFDWLRVWS